MLVRCPTLFVIMRLMRGGDDAEEQLAIHTKATRDFLSVLRGKDNGKGGMLRLSRGDEAWCWGIVESVIKQVSFREQKGLSEPHERGYNAPWFRQRVVALKKQVTESRERHPDIDDQVAEVLEREGGSEGSKLGGAGGGGASHDSGTIETDSEEEAPAALADLDEEEADLDMD